MARTYFTFFLVVLPTIFAHEAGFYNSEDLKNLINGGSEKVSEISKILDEVSKHYGELIAERFECLQWECIIEEKNVNKSTADAVIKGLLKKKKFSSFQCVSDKSREVLDKLKAKCSGLPQESGNVLKNGLNAVLPYRLLIPGFHKYTQELYQTKNEEMNKTDKEETKKKILSEVEDKMKTLIAVLDQIGSNIQASKHSFFEIYVDFVYATENALKKIQREGSQKILACIN